MVRYINSRPRLILTWRGENGIAASTRSDFLTPAHSFHWDTAAKILGDQYGLTGVREVGGRHKTWVKGQGYEVRTYLGSKIGRSEK